MSWPYLCVTRSLRPPQITQVLFDVVKSNVAKSRHFFEIGAENAEIVEICGMFHTKTSKRIYGAFFVVSFVVSLHKSMCILRNVT